MANILQEYLVSLGFRLNQPELDKLHRTLTDVSKQIESRTSGIAKTIAGVGTAVVAAYSGIVAATVGLADHFAEADLKQQLFAMRMFMSVDAAKRLQIAQEALGYSLEEIVWNPELHRRYDKLISDQLRLQKYLGPDYREQMKRIRDVRFEFTRMKVETQYLGMKVIQDLGRSFGLDENQILGKLREFNDWVIHNLPDIAQKINATLVPALKNIAVNAKDVWGMLKEAASAAEKFIGVLFDDKKLQSGELTFENLLRTIQQISFHTALWVEQLGAAVRGLYYVSRITGELSIPGAGLGMAKGTMKEWSASKLEYDHRIEQLYTQNGNLGYGNPYAGAANSIGAGSGAALRGYVSSSAPWASASSNPASSGGSSVASQARSLAMQVSAKTGVPAELIYAQWAHETNGFTDYKAGGAWNNLGGVMINKTQYRAFSSLADFGNYYSSLLTNKNYSSKGVLQARTPEEFASALKRGGYYSDTYQNYLGGLKRWEPSYSGGGGGGVIVEHLEVNVPHAAASAQDVKNATLKALDEKFNKKVTRNITQLSGAF